MTATRQNPAEQYRDIYRLLHRGQLEAAGHACQALVEAAPDYAPGWVVFSELWLRCGEVEKAGAAARQALQLDGDGAEPNTQFAKCLMLAGQSGPALVHARKAAEAGPGSALQFDTLGNLFSRVNEHEAALQMFVEAARLAPNNPDTLFNLAGALRHFGLSERAEQVLGQVLESHPADADAHYSRATLKRQTDESNHVDTLREQLARARHWQSRVKLHYALAKELEDLGQFEPAFDQLKAGADLMFQQARSSADQEVQAIRGMIETLSGPTMAEHAGRGHANEEPIFILGLPQSGTGLVERILAAHEDVLALGELRNFASAFSAVVGAGSVGAADIQGRIDQLDLKAIGEAYIHSTRPQTGNVRHFVDRQPDNLLRAGLIHLALPTARIIVVERDPMDQAFALYQSLSGPTHASRYDLDALGRYHSACRHLIDHWRAVIPASALMTVRLESILSDPDTVVRGLLDFCQLDWQDACLAAARQGDAALRPPGHWRPYEAQLAALAAALGDTAGARSTQ